MGTTLTGTTPQDTYDSLIKVTDNGPLSGSLKKLTDGLGNDSALSLSTGAASIAGTLAVSSTSAFGGNVAINGSASSLDINPTTGQPNITLRSGNTFRGYIEGNASGGLSFGSGAGAAIGMTLTSAGNVGIGLDSPASKLHIFRAGNGNVLTVGNDQTGSQVNIGVGVVTGGSPFLGTNNDSNPLEVGTQAPTDMKFLRASTEIARITANGLTFNGDTAAANALDDYEEGTWTPAVVAATGSGSPTYSTQLGTYTKIGRQVTVVLTLVFQKNTMSGGFVRIDGLPFTPAVNLYPQNAVLIDNLATALSNPILQVQEGQTFMVMLQDNGSTGNHAGMSVDTYLGAGNMVLRASATYFV